MSGRRRTFALGVAGILLAIPVLVSPGAIGQSQNRAAVVVQHGNPTEGGAECVSFDGELDGFDLVERSSFEYLAARFDLGRAMCWLDGEGCQTTDPSECFCDPVNSWSLWVQQGEDPPAPADTGADDTVVIDGTVHYWVWGPFGVPPVQPTTADDVCPAAAPGPSPEPTSEAPGQPVEGTAPSPDTGVAAERIELPATR